MKNYRFLIGDRAGLSLTFTVTAESPDEAVRIANEDISDAEEELGNKVFVGLHTQHPYIDLNNEFRVDKSMIIEETPATLPLPEEAFDLLLKRGYEYSGDKEGLWHDDQPSFIKSILTEQGDVYGYFRVTPGYRRDADEFSPALKPYSIRGPPRG